MGTGPGDPSLLTLRALRLMQTADVVLYDRLVSDEILALVHNGARMVYVGKEQGFHTRSQEEIHALMAQYAGAGASVLRLKAGDPFVFGRGGEEQVYLRARGISTVTVPGITAASGIAAELGIPLTHRGLATSVRYLTGHACVGNDGMLADATLAAAHDAHTTLVVYMGLGYVFCEGGWCKIIVVVYIDESRKDGWSVSHSLLVSRCQHAASVSATPNHAQHTASPQDAP